MRSANNSILDNNFFCNLNNNGQNNNNGFIPVTTNKVIN